jgi:glycosyltransferase involved in cell wall biosynthesis
MKVVFLSVNDDANLSYIISKSLQSVGVDSSALAIHRHKFNYDEQAEITNYKVMKKRIQRSNIVIFAHSEFVNTKADLTGKKVFVLHGGSRYRKFYKELNPIFNKIVHKSLIQTGDLLGLGAKNEVWIMAAVDTEKIKASNKKISDKIIISHFPSKVKTKGTEIIEQVIRKLQQDKTISNKFVYVSSKERISWSANLERMSKCDIYIDACKPILDGRKYGEFGIAGFEAAALGKILVTHFLSSDRYKKEFGEHPIQVINCESDIEQILRKLLSMSIEELQDLQIQTRQWVEKFHSFKAMGERLKNILST